MGLFWASSFVDFDKEISPEKLYFLNFESGLPPKLTSDYDW